MTKPVQIWGHRGCRQNDHYYENSLEAFEFAFEKSMGLETDAVRAGTGISLIHDTVFIEKVEYELAKHMDEKSQALLLSQTQQPPYLYKLGDDVVGQLYLKNGTALPTLSQILQILSKYPDRTLNIELKGPSAWKLSLDIIEKAVAEKLITRSQIVFSSFSHTALAELRQHVGTDYQIGCLFAKETQILSSMFPDWPDISEADKAGSYVPFSKDYLKSDMLQTIQPEFFNLETSVARLDNLDAILAVFPKAQIISWSLGEGNPQENDTVLNMAKTLYPTGKLHAVITDFPVEMRAVFEEHKIPV